jgi:hypothetical protein
LLSCTNPVKQPLVADVKIEISKPNESIDSILVSLTQNSLSLQSKLLNNVSNDTSVLFSAIAKGEGYSVSVKSYVNGFVKYSCHQEFIVQDENEMNLQLLIMPEPIALGNCWNSALSCDTVGGNYRISWSAFPDSAFFRKARMSYYLIMDTVMIPEDINPGQNYTKEYIYWEKVHPEYFDHPIGTESRAYFRLFLFSQTFLFYLKDCQTVLVQVRSGT